jgi:hypothetical protein
MGPTGKRGTQESPQNGGMSNFLHRFVAYVFLFYRLQVKNKWSLLLTEAGFKQKTTNAQAIFARRQFGVPRSGCCRTAFKRRHIRVLQKNFLSASLNPPRNQRASHQEKRPFDCAQDDATASLDFYLRSRRFHLLFDIFGFLLRHAFLDRFRSAFNQRLGLGQTEPWNSGTDLFNDTDFVRAHFL